MGPYPERRDLYVERSPISHIDGFKAPIIFFQVGNKGCHCGLLATAALC